MSSLSNFATTFKSTVYVSGFSDNLSENEIKTTLERIGTMNIFEIKNTDKGQRYAVVNFVNHIDAKTARARAKRIFDDEEVRASFYESEFTRPLQPPTVISDVHNHLPSPSDIIHLQDDVLIREVFNSRGFKIKKKRSSKTITAPPPVQGIMQVDFSIQNANVDNCLLAHHGDKALYRILIDYLLANYEKRFGFDKLLWLADELAENNTLGYISRLTGLSSTAGITDTKIIKLDGDVFEAYISAIINKSKDKEIVNILIHNLFGGLVEEVLNNEDYSKSKNDYEAREKFYNIFPAYYIRLQQRQLNNNSYVRNIIPFFMSMTEHK
ncbi:hypothetical protein RclHR1_00800004 [Rhizophagus clarus]|uniref:RRM domain-containing protein n=1 Tax=Rhizophagus clarus TaxID=94130 RepID=A0A2Z6SMC7_9GLOM|nr:hypothetical protein RclHR1_00800004 [Rhizophagus clarus]GES80014.1 hypothetical protein GLOIN_2v1783541 [Rhizophagus clarus]